MTHRKPPSMRNPENVQQRMLRTLQSMAPGTMGGRVANASPIATDSDSDSDAVVVSGSSGGAGVAELVFSFSGRLNESVSPPYRVTSASITGTTTFTATLGAAGSTSSRIDILKNNLLVASLTFASGDDYQTAAMVTTLTVGDVIVARVFTAGNGATDAGIQVGLG